MKVAYITTHSSNEEIELIKIHFTEYVLFNRIEQLIAANLEIDAIILAHIDQDIFLNELTAIRRSDNYFLSPVLTANKEMAKDLIDGNLLSTEEIKSKISTIQLMSKKLSTKAADWKIRLLQYLYTRDGKHLSPQRHWQKEKYYYYPLIDVFGGAQENYFLWLADMVMQNVLSKAKLVDQIFQCPSCIAAHLKFSEHCPNCDSINIKSESFLHCFSCGHVAPQEEFIKMDRLICPTCHTALRHIGDDYDRPLESGVCLNCSDYYMETVLKIDCMLCQKIFLAEQLSKQGVYELELTSQGKSLIEFNGFDYSVSIFDSINYVSQEYFYAMLDWLMALRQRYEDETFSLIGINLGLAVAVKEQQFLADFAANIRGILRKTDLLTRIRDFYIWLLLPKTDQAGVEKIIARIEEVSKTAQQIEKDFNILTVGFTATSDNIQIITAKMLLAKLAAKL